MVHEMARKRPLPDDASPPGSRIPLGEWAIPPEAYYDLFMPDDPEEYRKNPVPAMSAEAALARIRDVCAGVQGLINIVPTYLPVEGTPTQGPQLDGAGRERIIDEI